MKKPEKLTSVKIEKTLFDKFKISSFENSFSFKKLADRAIFLYLTDEEFRKKLHKQDDTEIN